MTMIHDEETTESGAEPTEDVEIVLAPVERSRRRISWSRVLAYGALPALALLLAMAAGYLKWQDSSARDAQLARTESVRAATDSTIAMLS
jgi:Mce-associated membrane protein